MEPRTWPWNHGSTTPVAWSPHKSFNTFIVHLLKCKSRIPISTSQDFCKDKMRWRKAEYSANCQGYANVICFYWHYDYLFSIDTPTAGFVLACTWPGTGARELGLYEIEAEGARVVINNSQEEKSRFLTVTFLCSSCLSHLPFQRRTTSLWFVSLGSCNKLSQTGWLKTTDIDSLPVLETKSLKSRCQHGLQSLWGFSGESFLASFSFQTLLEFLGLSSLSLSSHCLLLFHCQILNKL